MEGVIKIEDFQIHCVVGSHSYERKEEQAISLDIEMRLNFAECVQTDSVVDTVDYTEIGKLCSDLAKKRRYHLLETFAYETLHLLKDTFNPSWIKIRVKKQKALPLAKHAIVEMELSK